MLTPSVFKKLSNSVSKIMEITSDNGDAETSALENSSGPIRPTPPTPPPPSVTNQTVKS